MPINESQKHLPFLVQVLGSDNVRHLIDLSGGDITELLQAEKTVSYAIKFVADQSIKNSPDHTKQS